VLNVSISLTGRLYIAMLKCWFTTVTSAITAFYVLMYTVCIYLTNGI